MVANDLKMSNCELEMANKIGGISGGFPTVSSQFLNKHHKTTGMPNISDVILFSAEFLRWF